MSEEKSNSYTPPPLDIVECHGAEVKTYIWNVVCKTPDEVKKPISGGRMNGKTDINPMWRIKLLTELFGPPGKGWYTDQVRYTITDGGPTKEVAIECELNLYVKYDGFDGPWSAPIYGVGGNRVLSYESKGLHLDDDARKKAYTDALSIACKAIGICADVWFGCDEGKYSKENKAAPKSKAPAKGGDLRDAYVKLFSTPDLEGRMQQLKAIVESINASAGQANAFRGARMQLIEKGVISNKGVSEMQPEELADMLIAVAGALAVKLNLPA